jgi:hypothetical protein
MNTEIYNDYSTWCSKLLRSDPSQLEVVDGSINSLGAYFVRRSDNYIGVVNLDDTFLIPVFKNSVIDIPKEYIYPIFTIQKPKKPVDYVIFAIPTYMISVDKHRTNLLTLDTIFLNDMSVNMKKSILDPGTGAYYDETVKGEFLLRFNIYQASQKNILAFINSEIGEKYKLSCCTLNNDINPELYKKLCLTSDLYVKLHQGQVGGSDKCDAFMTNYCSRVNDTSKYSGLCDCFDNVGKASFTNLEKTIYDKLSRQRGISDYPVSCLKSSCKYRTKKMLDKVGCFPYCIANITKKGDDTEEIDMSKVYMHMNGCDVLDVSDADNHNIQKNINNNTNDNNNDNDTNKSISMYTIIMLCLLFLFPYLICMYCVYSLRKRR